MLINEKNKDYNAFVFEYLCYEQIGNCHFVAPEESQKGNGETSWKVIWGGVTRCSCDDGNMGVWFLLVTVASGNTTSNTQAGAKGLP